MKLTFFAQNKFKRSLEISLLILLSVYLVHVYSVRNMPDNGFDLSNSIVPLEEIFHGGPPKDGIPALTDPKFVAAREATWLNNDDRVLGIAQNGIAKAYPLKILNLHEIVNDKLGGDPVLITYCPLCFSGMAFDPVIEGERHLFGVSGLLYNSDVLLYDRKTNSLWSQIMSRGIAGDYTGKALETIPIVNTTWRDWQDRYPDTRVLSKNTGHFRNYDRDPYDGYRESPRTMFPVKFRAEGYHPKELVLGITLNNKAKAYPYSELSRMDGIFRDTLAGREILIRFDKQEQVGEIRDSSCQAIPATTLYWFAWFTFHPDTMVFKANDNINEKTGSISCPERLTTVR